MIWSNIATADGCPMFSQTSLYQQSQYCNLTLFFTSFNALFASLIAFFPREKGSVFISAATLGAYGFVFSDFGQAFSVRDVTGEAPISRIITDVRLGMRLELSLRFVGMRCRHQYG